MDQHPPHRRRRAEARHAAARELPEERAGVETLVVIREHRRRRVPGREQARPGVLRPPGRAEIQVHVPGLEAQPVHGRQMPDRIARLRVRDQLRPCGGTGGEVQEQQLIGARPRGVEPIAGLVRAVVVGPARGARSHGDTHRRAGQSREAPRELRVGHDPLDPPALYPIAQIVALEERRRGNHDCAEPDRGEHRFPQRHAVGQHDEESVALLEALRVEEARHLSRAARQLGERERPIAARIVDDAQRWRVVARGDHVEVVVRPVELLEGRPAELALRTRPVLPEAQQQVPQLEKAAAGAHDGAPHSILPGELNIAVGGTKRSAVPGAEAPASA